MKSHLRIQAFQGLVPSPQFVDHVHCVPYDVVNTAEAKQLAEGNPYSLLHVDRAEIDLPANTNPYSNIVYETARQKFMEFQKNGALVHEKQPSLYLYQQTMGNHQQTGLAALCHVEDYDGNLIKKHEKTRQDKEDDRTRLIDTIGANTGPVFLTYQNTPALQELFAKVKKGAPTYDITAPDGIRHTVWRITDCEPWIKLFQEIPYSYIADGHHRAASAARVARKRRSENPQHTGKETYNWFLCVLFPANELKILPYNRCVTDLNGQTPESFLKKIGEEFTVEPTHKNTPEKSHQICMYLDGKWYVLTPKNASAKDPVSSLDVSILQDRLLAPILGIEDPRTSSRIDFIGGIRGPKELEQRVNSGQAAVAFSMYPTTVTQMMDIADAGQIMPPKSTWFEPKLRTGFFIHTLDSR